MGIGNGMSVSIRSRRLRSIQSVLNFCSLVLFFFFFHSVSFDSVFMFFQKTCFNELYAELYAAVNLISGGLYFLV